MHVETESVIARNLSFRHLRAFVCVARTSSFTRAADQLAMSQPALTLNIHQFEEMVGLPLFIRTTRTVSLTPAGKVLLEQVEKILGQFEKAICDVRKTSFQLQNHVNVAVLPSVAIRMLPNVISNFSKDYSKITIQLHDDNGRGVQAQVLNGSADFGVSSMWEQNPDLDFTPLVRDRIGLVCRATHPIVKIKKKLSWDDLMEYPFVGMTDDTGINRMMQRFEGLPESIRNPKNSVLTIAALVGLLEHGENLSVLPALAAPGYLNPSLIYRDIANPTRHREICLITSHRQRMSEATSTFYRFLIQKRNEICGRFPNNTLVPHE